jgi:hypothetical protein
MKIVDDNVKITKVVIESRGTKYEFSLDELEAFYEVLTKIFGKRVEYIPYYPYWGWWKITWSDSTGTQYTYNTRYNVAFGGHASTMTLFENGENTATVEYRI